MISHRSCWPTQLPIRFSQVELAAVLRRQARRTTVPGPAFLPDEGDAARGLQCVDREAAIAYTALRSRGVKKDAYPMFLPIKVGVQVVRQKLGKLSGR
jgi:hypothetical protein